MKYAKLINNELIYAPRKLNYQNSVIYNPSNELLLQEGYKPVTYTNYPSTEEGYIAVSSWQETENEILQVWSIEPEGDISNEEVLSIILGE